MPICRALSIALRRPVLQQCISLIDSGIPANTTARLTCQDPSNDPDNMNVSDANLVTTNIRAIRKEHILHSRQPTLQSRQGSRLQALHELWLRNQWENSSAILHERLIVESLRWQQRQDGLEGIVAPYLEGFVRFACGDLIFSAELVEDHVDDGGGVGVDIAADCEDGDSAVGDVQSLEVGRTAGCSSSE
jgi:hypothetical protein